MQSSRTLLNRVWQLHTWGGGAFVAGGCWPHVRKPCHKWMTGRLCLWMRLLPESLQRGQQYSAYSHENRGGLKSLAPGHISL